MSMSAQLREAQDARSARAAARHIMPAVTTNRELPANFAAAAYPEIAAAAASPAPQQQQERAVQLSSESPTAAARNRFMAELADRPAAVARVGVADQSGVECTLCQGPFQPHEQLTSLSCGHAFHFECIKIQRTRPPTQVCQTCYNDAGPTVTHEESVHDDTFADLHSGQVMPTFKIIIMRQINHRARLAATRSQEYPEPTGSVAPGHWSRW